MVEPDHYRAFMVRFWRTDDGSEWRASAQAVETGALKRFASTADLFDYLRSHLAEKPQPTADEPSADPASEEN